MPILRIVLIVWLITAMSACGFQLRGSQRALHKSFPSIQLVASDRDPSFSLAIKQALEDARIQQNGSSINRLDIIRTRDQKRTASYSSRAKSAEFELIKSVTFRFSREDKELIAPMQLEARRSYLYRETAAVGKAEEEILLRQEMDQDLAQRIMLAIQRVADTQQQADQGAGVP